MLVVRPKSPTALPPPPPPPAVCLSVCVSVCVYVCESVCWSVWCQKLTCDVAASVLSFHHSDDLCSPSTPLHQPSPARSSQCVNKATAKSLPALINTLHHAPTQQPDINGNATMKRVYRVLNLLLAADGLGCLTSNVRSPLANCSSLVFKNLFTNKVTVNIRLRPQSIAAIDELILLATGKHANKTGST